MITFKSNRWCGGNQGSLSTRSTHSSVAGEHGGQALSVAVSGLFSEEGVALRGFSCTLTRCPRIFIDIQPSNKVEPAVRAEN